MTTLNVSKKLRVLLVEEDPVQADIIRKSLAVLAKEVKWFRTGKELLGFLGKDTCDFIIIDHHLGDILGLEVIEEMKKRDLLRIPTIILVEPGKEPIVVDAMKMGVFSFVVKTGSYWLYLPGLVERGIEWSKKADNINSKSNGKHYIIDKLTSIPTEHVFMVSLKNELKRTERYGRKYTLLILDIKDLSKINLTYGEEVGNQVLRSVAKIITETVRGSDMVCRHTGGADEFSGDEFLVLLETDQTGTELVINRLKSVIRSATKGLNLPAELDLDIGYVQIAGDMKDPLRVALKSLKRPS